MEEKPHSSAQKSVYAGTLKYETLSEEEYGYMAADVALFEKLATPLFKPARSTITPEASRLGFRFAMETLTKSYTLPKMERIYDLLPAEHKGLCVPLRVFVPH